MKSCVDYAPQYKRLLRLPAIMNQGYVPCRFLFYARVEIAAGPLPMRKLPLVMVVLISSVPPI
ncbi:uncharacterized protein TOL2_C27840 [Desulfobacula toluolica Tol2]|uniref:Uncharacterized protein n=1 Tax=Desulfobacula toluolica (strain DSM 7467 / Tol2) TaxID=651182 RepID=K0NA66_DESTT|nr:uncharacterized protein TOL2_C27840 [Desulfobacula toluolica Tol2]